MNTALFTFRWRVSPITGRCEDEVKVFNGAKVAAERYDPDDGLVRDSPPLEKLEVNLNPTPSPDYCPSESSDSPDPSGRKRAEPQASQGDAVLINFMGGFDHPELASKAGEEALPFLDDNSVDESHMDIDSSRREDSQQDHAALVRLAADTLPLTQNGDSRPTSRENALGIENLKPQRPTILTENRPFPSNERRILDASTAKLSHRNSSERGTIEDSERKVLRAATDGPPLLNSHGLQHGQSPNILNDDEPVSEVMRRNTLPASHRSPNETLAPLQSQGSPASFAKSPGPESLPSLEQTNLKNLMNSKPPTENWYKDPGVPQIPISKTLNSPPLASMARKASTSYPSPRSRMNSTFGPPFGPGHPSPVTTDTSPRDSSAMSPPGRPGSHQFTPMFSAGSTQSEDSTPQSALSSGSYSSTVPSPQIGGEQMEVDRAGRLLPPLVAHQGPPLMTGAFKCDYPGCTAAAFQTQYLLK